MITRSQLLSLTIEQLRALADLYDVKPLGDGRYIINWVDALVGNRDIIVNDLQLGEGLQFPSGQSLLDLRIFTISLGNPSIMQAALIGASKQGRQSSDEMVRYHQRQLLLLFEARSLLFKALILFEQD